MIIKNGIKFFVPNDQLRDKYHHAPDLDSPIPRTLVEGELARLADPSLYRERLETFRNKEVLTDAYVEQYGRDLRLHVLDPYTKIIKGTLGGNHEANGSSISLFRLLNFHVHFKILSEHILFYDTF